VIESTISGNTTAAVSEGEYFVVVGGGLYVQLNKSASLTVDNTVVHDNHATSGNGGGILATALYVSEPDPNQRAITITRSTISENTANV
jgi:predicted outer membrane repeat protein